MRNSLQSVGIYVLNCLFRNANVCVFTIFDPNYNLCYIKSVLRNLLYVAKQKMLLM